MATAFTPTHTHQATGGLQAMATPTRKPARRSPVATFVRDLIEDLRQKPLQPAHLAKHDIFREHINAMSISYFALILLLIALSLPVLAYLVQY